MIGDTHRYCSYCGETVLADGHSHDPKICQDCKRELPLVQFPVQASSLDGHRHQCAECAARRRAADKERRRDAREHERDEFRRYGLRWVLMNEATGEVFTPAEATAYIERIKAEAEPLS